jgi:tetratricopeptide (TPR) repeat protein
LEYNEKEGDSYRKASCYNNLGNIYLEMNNPEKSLNYYKKSLELRTNIGDKEGIASVYGNIAALEQKLNSIG